MRNVVFLAWLPMALAVAGAWIDERAALGFTIWRSACRASGISLTSLATFTFELLPTAMVGALLGGLGVLAVGARARGPVADDALAAHAGCVVAMPAGLLLCASAWPWPLALAAETALGAIVAVAAWWFMRIRKATYAHGACRGISRIPRPAVAAENFPVVQHWNTHDRY
jgi:hypothetical protein